MKRVTDILLESALFKGMDPKIFDPYIQRINTRILWKGEVYINEGDESTHVGIVISGHISLQKYSRSGDYVTIELLEPNQSFGEEYLYADSHVTKMTAEAISNAKILTMSKDILMSLMKDYPMIKERFLTVLSNKIQLEQRRIAILSQRNLRQKIAVYLIDLLSTQSDIEDIYEYAQKMKKNQALAPSVEISSSKEIVARLLAMSRPSFSRELLRMEKDGLIRVSGRVIWLTDLEGLEQRESSEDTDEED